MQIKSLVQKTISVRRYDEPLNKYVYLNDLLCTNERLFYKLLSENVEELMPIVYTPTVGLACQKFGYIFSKPQVNIAVLWEMMLIVYTPTVGLACQKFVCIFFKYSHR